MQSAALLPPAPGAFAPYFPPGGAPTPGDGLAVTSTDARGWLSFVHLAPVPNEPAWTWTALSTRGRRSMEWGEGTFLTDDGNDPCMQAVACARADRRGYEVEGFRPAALAFLLLAEGLAGAARGRWDAFVRACGNDTLEAAAAGLDPALLGQVHAAFGERRVSELVERHPILVSILAGLVGKDPGAASGLAFAGTDPRAFARAFAERIAAGGAAVPSHRDDADAHVRALALLVQRAGSARPGAAHAFDAALMCGLAPHDWMPGTADGVWAMARILDAARLLRDRSGGALPVGQLIAPVRGDWGRMAASLMAMDPRTIHDAAAWASDVGDMAKAFANEAMGPALAHAGWTEAGEPGIPGAGIPAIEAAAWKVLFGGKGLLAVAEASLDWHGGGAAISQGVRELSTRRGAGWPRPCPDFVASNGRSVRPILSAAELAEEGGQLRHCVGSYAKECAGGTTYVLSVRDPSGARSSTLQLAPDWRVVQHRAHRNAAPPAEDVRAASELVDALRAARATRARVPIGARLLAIPGRIRDAAIEATAPPVVHTYAYDPRAASKVATALGLWERYLPRPARGSIAAAVAAVDPKGAEVLSRLGSRKAPIARDRLLRAAPVLCGMAWRFLPPGLRFMVKGGIAIGCTVLLIGLVAASIERASRNAREETAALDKARAEMLADDGRSRWGHVDRARRVTGIPGGSVEGTSMPLPTRDVLTVQSGPVDSVTALPTIGSGGVPVMTQSLPTMRPAGDYRSWKARNPDGTDEEYLAWAARQMGVGKRSGEAR